jgi:flagellar protein FliL
MSDKKAETTEGKPAAGKLKLIILLVIVLLLVAGGGGAAYYFLVLRSAEHAQTAAEGGDHGADTGKEDAKGGEHGAADGGEDGGEHGAGESQLIYHPLDPITVNISAAGPVRFLKINMTVVTKKEAVIAAITKHMPMIRNDLLSTLAGQNFAVINTPEGKDALRQQLKTIITVILTRASEPSAVEDILFTELVMQ